MKGSNEVKDKMATLQEIIAGIVGGVAPTASAGSGRVASPETVAAAQAVTDRQAPVGGATGTGYNAELLGALGYTPIMSPDGKTILGYNPPTPDAGVTAVGSPTGHLETVQSQRVGGNFQSGGQIGSGGSRVGGGGIALGGGSGDGGGGASVSRLDRLLAQLQKKDIVDRLSSGSNQRLPTGGSTNPLYAGAGTIAPAPALAPAPTQSLALAAPPPPAAPSAPSSVVDLSVGTSETPTKSSNPDALALLSELIGSGGLPSTQANTGRQGIGAEALLATLTGLGGLAAGETTAPLTGALQGIARDFREQVFPQIARSAEVGGSSKGALRSLLENDALSRQQEVQSELALQAQQQAVAGQAALAQALQSLTQTSPISQELLALLSAGAALPESGTTPLTSTSLGIRTV